MAAAKYLLSSDFKTAHGFDYEKIWLIGGSAGGYLALWTHVNLPVAKVAGTIAFSPIAAPWPDYRPFPGRYSGAAESNKVGHCIWRPNSSPHHLLSLFGRRIRCFVGATIP